jgi:glycosyltransferase A (GT-A) superfamily protein (DUF2064 family)
VVLDRPPFSPPVGGAELARALSEDLHEALGALPLRISREPLADLLGSTDQPVVITFSDVPALPWQGVDAALEELEYGDVVVGPAADGSIYLLAVRPGVAPEVTAALANAGQELAALVEALDGLDMPCTVLPPWFRIGSEQALAFARSLVQLSLRDEHADQDYAADRLRIWLERYGEHL